MKIELARTRPLPIAELVLSLVCLWAAWYHTPAGALLRLLFGGRSRPLLSYYGSGVDTGKPSAAPPPALPGPVPPSQALAYGIWAVRGGRLDAARTELAANEQRLGSEEAAVLAVFAGEESARYALDTAGEHADLRDLARALPPGYDEAIGQASRALTFGGAYALGWPLPPAVRITSPFGVRGDPLLGERRLHAGVDLGVASGTPVHASAAGVVRRASADASNGRMIVLDHGRGVVTIYCHNDALLVTAGQHVERGQVIARSGTTGRSTGPHLHYQIDLLGQPVDPLRYRATPVRVAAGGRD